MGPGKSGFLSLDDFKKCNGINHQCSQVRIADITDGTSCTYLVGEKYCDPDYYYTGDSYNDDDPPLGGDDLDWHGWTCYMPLQDTAGGCTFVDTLAAPTPTASIWLFATAPSKRSATRSTPRCICILAAATTTDRCEKRCDGLSAVA